MAMSKEHQDKLRRNRVRLASDLEISEALFAVLRQENTLTGDMQEEIEAEKTRRDKVGKLLDTLPMRGKRAFERFIEALCSSSQEELAELLDPVLCSKYRENDANDEPDVTDQVAPAQDTNKLIALEIEKPDFQVKVNPMPQNVKKKLCSDSNRTYPVLGETCGRALIVGNKKGAEDSLGIENDAKILTALFKQLHFVTDVKMISTALQLHSVLEDESKLQSPSCSAFVLCILSYGSRSDEVYCPDEQPVKIDSILQYFDGERCSALRGKPKLVFIHTGEPKSNTDEHDGSSDTDSRSFEADSGSAYVTDGVPESSQPHNVVHEKADLLLILSTSDVWRCKLKGSWFIRCLAAFISRHADSQHLEEIMTKVNSFIAEQKATGKSIQLPIKRAILRKTFYFIP